MKDAPITQQTLLQLARLARLRLEDDEVRRLAEQLGAIVAYMDLLASVGPAAPGGEQPSSFAMPLRGDEPEPSLSRESVLGQSHRADDDGFVVPPGRHAPS